MTDTTWAAKVLEGVPRYSLDFCDRMEIDKDGAWMHVDDALAAIARMGAGDDMVERLLENDREIFLPLLGEAAAHIAALTAQNREMALDVLASSGQAQEAYAAQLAVEVERDALRAKVARLEGAVMWARDRIAVDSGMTKAETKRTADELLNVLRGKPSPASDYAPETWQSPTRAALTDGGTEYERKVAQMKKDFPNGI